MSIIYIILNVNGLNKSTTGQTFPTHTKKQDQAKCWKQETDFTNKSTYELKTKIEIVI